MPGGQGPKTVKGAQSDPNYVSRLLARTECLPGGGKNYSYPTGPRTPGPPRPHPGYTHALISSLPNVMMNVFQKIFRFSYFCYFRIYTNNAVACCARTAHLLSRTLCQFSFPAGVRESYQQFPPWPSTCKLRNVTLTDWLYLFASETHTI